MIMYPLATSTNFLAVMKRLNESIKAGKYFYIKTYYSVSHESTKDLSFAFFNTSGRACLYGKVKVITLPRFEEGREIKLDSF